MQDDIITIKKPPASALPEQPVQEASVAKEESASVQSAPKMESRNRAPIGIIMAAIFICVCLIAAAVYSTLTQA